MLTCRLASNLLLRLFLAGDRAFGMQTAMATPPSQVRRGQPRNAQSMAIALKPFLSLVAFALFMSLGAHTQAQAPEKLHKGELLSFPGPWAFQWSRGGHAVFTTDEQFESYVSDAVAEDADNPRATEGPIRDSNPSVCR